MTDKQISKDDIYDILDLSEKIEQSIHKILEDHDLDIALSALIRANISIILDQSDSIQEFALFKKVFMQFFDLTTRIYHQEKRFRKREPDANN